MTPSPPTIEFLEGVPEVLSQVSMRRRPSTGANSVKMSFTHLKAIEGVGSFTRRGFNSMRLIDAEGTIDVTPSTCHTLCGGEDGAEFARLDVTFDIDREEHLDRFMRFMNRYAESAGLEYTDRHDRPEPESEPTGPASDRQIEVDTPPSAQPVELH